MSVEVDSSNKEEMVFWVNRFSEKGVRKILESLRILNPSKEAALTVIPAHEIDNLEDDQLRESLNRQLQDVREHAWTMELPVAHMPQRQFSHSYSVLTEASADIVHRRIDTARQP